MDLKTNEIKKKKEQVEKIKVDGFFGEMGVKRKKKREMVEKRRRWKKEDGENKGEGQKRDQEKKRKRTY